MKHLTLVSYDLCPYVQRAAIVLAEKEVRSSASMSISLTSPNGSGQFPPPARFPCSRLAMRCFLKAA